MKKKTHKSKIEKRDADVSIQGSRALWMFDEYENDVNHMLLPLQSPHLNPVEHLRWSSEMKVFLSFLNQNSNFKSS